ncbi:MAG TPA: tRNA (adenosine(37)-N6)-dimethylallyltransferase MiaA [Spirochaetota bacterium]|nr:tRNA (adenosine(37)-N6)-dimethylallyltransferase MiaA [Spirochaetota bacterium]
MSKILAIIGPTATGKSDLAGEIAEDIFEIISADSVQVYRYMDIGSSKPDKALLERVRHHLIDIVDPDYQFTAGEFCQRCVSACSDIEDRGKIPLIVGGTGLYISSYFFGLSQIPEIDKSIKLQLMKEANERGLESLYEELQRVDEIFARNVHKNDRQRIVRGLEVYRGTGKPISSFYSEKAVNVNSDVLIIGLEAHRDILKLRIESRVDLMIKKGLVDEVYSLRERGYGSHLNSMRSIGYGEINDYIDGKYTLDEAIEKIKVNTKRYAKKQMTWFKRIREVIWLDFNERDKIKEKIKIWLKI